MVKKCEHTISHVQTHQGKQYETCVVSQSDEQTNEQAQSLICHYYTTTMYFPNLHIKIITQFNFNIIYRSDNNTMYIKCWCFYKIILYNLRKAKLKAN